MSLLKNLFETKKTGVLNLYCTAGYPELDSTLPVMEALERHGADIIELGMPYSDPLADGPVIQQSSAVALANGMTIPLLFRQLEGMRERITIPVILMGYLNPVLQFGFERFRAGAAAVGVDALILPDMPPHAYEQEYRPIMEKHGLDLVFLVTPETSDERVRLLDQLSNGFLYAVSSSSVTGSSSQRTGVEDYLKRLQSLGLRNPVLVGFGISNRTHFLEASTHAQGAIIGTAYIKALAGSTDIDATTQQFLAGILGTQTLSS